MPRLDPPPITIGRLSLCFVWREDRFAHRVSWGDPSGGAARLLIESVEGAPDDPWPPSPPLQEFHVEARSEGRLVALSALLAG